MWRFLVIITNQKMADDDYEKRLKEEVEAAEAKQKAAREEEAAAQEQKEAAQKTEDAAEADKETTPKKDSFRQEEKNPKDEKDPRRPGRSGTEKDAWGRVRNWGAGAAGFAGGAAAGALATGASAGQTAAAHVKENTFFLAILFISLLDAFNNMSRSNTTVQINLFLLIAIGVLLLFSFLAPTKLFFGIIGLAVIGTAMQLQGYMGYSIPTFSANILFFFAFLVIFLWAWLGVYSKEGQGLFSKESMKHFALALGLSALSYFMPIIRNTIFPSNPLVDGIIVVAPVWLVYMLFFKADTQLIKVLGGMYIIFWIVLLLFKSGAAQAAIYGAAKTAQEGGAEVDSKSGIQALIENLQGSITKTQKELSGESLHGEVKSETKNIFIGVELLDPLIGYSTKFDPDVDMTIKVGAQLHINPYLETEYVYTDGNQLVTSMSCYGGSSDVVKSTSDFIEVKKFSLAQMSDTTFTGELIFPEEVTCTYEAKSRKNQIVVMQAASKGFKTGAYVENYYIDKESLESTLKRYATDNKKTLSTVSDVRSAIGSIETYSGLPNNVYSYSDNGPGKLVMTVSDFPLVGIDTTERGQVTLKSAIENQVPTSGKVGTFNGRIEKINTVKVTLPDGFSPATSGCEEWSSSGNTITLRSEALATLNQKVQKLKKGEQQRFPECRLALTDPEAILLKKDRPNPAAINAFVDYDYTVQRSFTITSKNPKEPKNTTTETPIPDDSKTGSGSTGNTSTA